MSKIFEKEENKRGYKTLDLKYEEVTTYTPPETKYPSDGKTEQDRETVSDDG